MAFSKSLRAPLAPFRARAVEATRACSLEGGRGSGTATRDLAGQLDARGNRGVTERRAAPCFDAAIRTSCRWPAAAARRASKRLRNSASAGYELSQDDFNAEDGHRDLRALVSLRRHR
eukprot:571024-Prorocentrum_lima.AAC.1